MIRLNIVVEGQTEESFVRDLLGPHLAVFDVACFARRAKTGRKRGVDFKGGVLSYPQFRQDLVRWIRQDQRPDAFFSTLIDLYGLPHDFPGFDTASLVADVYARVENMEDAFSRDICHHLDHFLPYIQPHEFEALLFSSPMALALPFPGELTALARLQDDVRRFDTPEHIDDDNPPSKRILALFPQYRKATDGTIIAAQLGLDVIRGACRHFDAWLRKLESLGRRA